MTEDKLQDCVLDTPNEVDNLAALVSLDLITFPYNRCRPKGHTIPGDVLMPYYQLEPANGRFAGDNGVFLSSTKPGWIWVAESVEKLDIRYWGARQGHDNLAAIQSANNHSGRYGGITWIPDGIWDHSQPIIVRNNSIIEGQSHNSILRSSNDGSRVTMKATFFLGCHHPAQNDNYLFFDGQATNQGDQTLTLKNESESQLLTVGKCVFIQSADRIKAGPRILPIFQETKRIVAINGSVITFDRPLDNTYSNPKITDPQDAQIIFGYVPSFILDRAIIRNLSVETDGGRWCLRAGTYDCLFENIRVLKSDSLIYGNAFYRTTFRDIVGHFSARMIEIASGAGFLVMEGIHGTFLDRGEDLSLKPVIRAGEYCRNITLDNWSVFAHNHSASLIKIQANHFKIMNGKVTITGTKGALIQFHSDHASKMIYGDNIISDCDIYSEGADRFIRFGGKRGTQPERNMVLNVKFRGTLAHGGDAVSGSSKFNEIKNCWFEDGGINFNDHRFIKNTFTSNSFFDVNQGEYESQNLVRNERRVCLGLINTLRSHKNIRIKGPQKNCDIDCTILPAEPLSIGDGYYVSLFGNVIHGIGSCTISFMINHVELAGIQFHPGEIGSFGIEATMYSQSMGGNHQLWIVKGLKKGRICHNITQSIKANHVGSTLTLGGGTILIFKHSQLAGGDELIISELLMEPRLIGVNV